MGIPLFRRSFCKAQPRRIGRFANSSSLRHRRVQRGKVTRISGKHKRKPRPTLAELALPEYYRPNRCILVYAEVARSPDERSRGEK